jgi:hypothetical protein
MTKLTWLGDEDPEAQVITVGGVRFLRGEATEVKDKDLAEQLGRNPLFSSDAKAEATEVSEPDEETREQIAEQGTVKAALKRELAGYGVTLKGNPSEDTLRSKLAEQVSKANS